MTDNLQTLLERLQNAEGPDREIDGYLARMFDTPPLVGSDTFDWKYIYPGTWRKLVEDDDCHPGLVWHAKNYTDSLDASIELVEKVLPGWVWTIRSSKYCLVARYSQHPLIELPVYGATTALALLTALVQALIAEQE